MNDHQTAVDFLMDKLFDPSTMVTEQIQWFEQAKEMEKQQIIKAYENTNSMAMYGEQYYNETYNIK